MIEHSQDISALAKAMHSAQGALGGVVRDAKNPHFKSSYATLESVVNVAKPALQSAGIAFTQAPGALIDGALEVTTMLIHAESGQWMRSTLHVPLAKRDPQGVGSAITYACRYSLMAALGIPPVDDDGEAASLRGDDRPSPPAKAHVRMTGGPLDIALSRIRVAQRREDLAAIKNELLPSVQHWPDKDRETLNTEYKAAWERLADERNAA